MDFNNEHHFKDYVLSRNLEELPLKSIVTGKPILSLLK